jgi:hypothetical protein
MRPLVDLSARGERIVRDLLGLPEEPAFNPNWNHGTAAEPALSSILLPPEMFAPLAVFCLLDDGAEVVAVTRTNGVHGLFRDDRERKDPATTWRDLFEQIYGAAEVEAVYQVNPLLPGRGTRCEHGASGRLA